MDEFLGSIPLESWLKYVGYAWITLSRFLPGLVQEYRYACSVPVRMSLNCREGNRTRQFKDALVEFVVAKRINYKLVRNEKDKVSAKSKGDDCPWGFMLHLTMVLASLSKAKMRAKNEINVRVLYEFNRLFDYAATLKKAGPSFIVDLMVERPSPNHNKICKMIYML
ncbi:hypothetical protein V6N13_006234 [Hibiscus sabdariffa]